MAPLAMYVVEAFTIGTNQPFSGNTAAVCILNFDDDMTDELKQKIAMQMNLSETAFVAQGWTKSDPFDSPRTNRWTLRWFTPTSEIVLCGHATLGAAHVLFHQIVKKQGSVSVDTAKESTIVFETKFKGQLKSTINWSNGLIALDFPTNVPIPLVSVPNNDSDLWLDKFTAELVGPKVAPSIVDDVQFASGIKFMLVRLKNTGNPDKNKEQLTQIQPNFNNLRSVNTARFKVLGVIVTSQGWTEQAKDKPQFYSRLFAPWDLGIDEDPVTGSAHTVLTPYWLQQFKEQGLQIKSGEILGLQLSARKGELLCSMPSSDRVKMEGQSRLAMTGEFYPV